MLSDPNSSMAGSEWIVRIRNILDKKIEDDDDVSVSIAGVPKPLMSSKPEAFIPQVIALGPYHHNREELHQTERYKLSAAKKIRIRLPDTEFQRIVDLFSKLELRIRAHYQRYLPFDGETLAWMMAIDASFVLEFIQIFTVGEPESLLRIPSRRVQRVYSMRRTSIQDMLIRDVIMLENQIPLFLLLKILELQATSAQIAEEALTTLVISFINELTPFKMSTNIQLADISSHSHLLELLYHSITPICNEEPHDLKEENDAGTRFREVARVAERFIRTRAKSLMSFLVKILIKIPWNIITSIPTFAMLRVQTEQIDANMQLELTQTASQGPLSEEIAIPSVTELANVGIRFEPTHRDLSSVTFDAKTATLHLPVINLDINSEIVLRNLVAYEATIITGPLTFTRYVDLMNGIIDSAEDARLLRENGVLVNRLRSDEEVAELWNGMSRSLRLTKVKVLDEVIEEVNKYYDGRLKVKIGRFVKKYVKRYVVSSWESLVVFIVILLVMLLGLQAVNTGFGLKFGSWAYKTRGSP